MKIEKIAGFHRIFQTENFPNEVDGMFGKNKGERKRYLQWLYTWLTVLDEQGQNALSLQQFEYLQNTKEPRLYALRHPHSKINERYIFIYADGDAVVLLTAFMEKSANDYKAAIARAKSIYQELEVNGNNDL